jgi:hypothetical protein
MKYRPYAKGCSAGKLHLPWIDVGNGDIYCMKNVIEEDQRHNTEHRPGERV